MNHTLLPALAGGQFQAQKLPVAIDYPAALALTRGDFLLRQQYPFVQLTTLKQREDKAKRRVGRRAAGVVLHRLVPLSDAQYVTQLEMMIATLRIPLERRSEKTGRTEKVRLWDITDRTARTLLNEAVEPAHFSPSIR